MSIGDYNSCTSIAPSFKLVLAMPNGKNMNLENIIEEERNAHLD